MFDPVLDYYDEKGLIWKLIIYILLLICLLFHYTDTYVDNICNSKSLIKFMLRWWYSLLYVGIPFIEIYIFS